MKAILSTLILTLAASLASAQTSSVPTMLSYQGRVTDVSGVLIGNTTPVNRTVTFRVYSAATGGTPIYAETQTVTISGGEFSILLGNGTGVSGVPGPSAPGNPLRTLPDLLNSANTTGFYLGITVDDGTAAVDTEVSPRQQLVSAAFSMRSRVAETVANQGVSSSMIADSSVTTQQIGANAVTSAKIADATIVAAKIANNAITASKLDATTIGLWSPSGSNIYRSSNVGIGEASPNFPLTFSSILGDKISLWGNSGAHFGFGIQGSTLQIHADISNSDIALGYGSSNAFTETMRVRGNGNVGIGTSLPSEKLHVNGGALRVSNGVNPQIGVFSNTGSAELGIAFNAGSFSTSAGANDAVLRSSSVGRLHLQSGNGNAAISINTSQWVGINNVVNPETQLHVNGGIYARGGAPGGSGNFHNGYAFSGNGGDNDSGLYSTIDGQIELYTDSIERMRVNSSGKVLINTTDNNGGPLTVGGTITSRGLRSNGTVGYANFGYGLGGSATISVYNNFVTANDTRTVSFDGDNNWDFNSDARMKKDINDAEPMLDRVMQVRFHRYRWLNEPETGKHEFGVIAQELQPLFPDIVGERVNPGDTQSTFTVGYGTFGTIACKAIQELKTSTDGKLDGLEKELTEKDAKIAALEARLNALEQRMSVAK